MKVELSGIESCQERKLRNWNLIDKELQCKPEWDSNGLVMCSKCMGL